MGDKDELIATVDLTNHRYSERCDKATDDLIHKGWDSESYLIATLLAELIAAENQRNELEQALKMATDTIAEYQHVLAMFDDEGSYEIHVEIDQDDNCHILMSADDWYRLQALSSMKRVHPQSFMDQGGAELESPWVDADTPPEESDYSDEGYVLVLTKDNTHHLDRWDVWTAESKPDYEGWGLDSFGEKYVVKWMPIPRDGG